ncbi:MAG: aldo/keto reductase [Porticoccaceae bacterium]|nr:MAG: aldo/keto reductase [Porticoccaceae bacterium]
MKYRRMGNSGLVVSELCLGSNMFGGAQLPFWKELGGLDQGAVDAVVAAAWEGGVNFFDTADGYALGEAEMLLGRALRNLGVSREEVVICTKGGFPMGASPNRRGASRKHLIAACEASLKRLDTDYIDLYLLHTFDPVTPLEETLRALTDLVRAGKVRYLGASNFAAWEVVKCLGIAAREGLEPLVAAQNHWSVATRQVELDLLPMAQSEGVGVMAWGALLGGALTGKYRRDGSATAPGRRGLRLHPSLDRERVFAIVDALAEIAAAHGVTAAEVALAALLRHGATTSVIFGATSPEQVRANLRASDLVLEEAEWSRLDALCAPQPAYGDALTGGARAERLPYLKGPVRQEA